ncbi:MAG: hypothetical protein ACD_9C00271G0001, partial [uncultured bacterium]
MKPPSMGKGVFMQKIKMVIGIVLCIAAFVAIYNAKISIFFGEVPRTTAEVHAAVAVLITRLILAASCLMAAWLIRPQRRNTLTH